MSLCGSLKRVPDLPGPLPPGRQAAVPTAGHVPNFHIGTG